MAGDWRDCQEGVLNPLVMMGTQMACILVISHFFYLMLKPLGQPGPIAQILAGLVLGPTGLSRIKVLGDFFFQKSAAGYYQTMSLFARVIIVFLMGLEMDIPYTWRYIRPAAIIACGGGIMCSIFAAAISPFIYKQFDSKGPMFGFVLIQIMLISSTASPVVSRIATELRLATSSVGRIAISSALFSDMVCLVLFSIVRVGMGGKEELWGNTKAGFGILILVVFVVVVNKYLAGWLNRRNRNRKYLKNAEIVCVLALVITTSMIIELGKKDSMIPSFVLGLMLPREGKTTRTLVRKIGYCVYNFILPIYFGYTGFQADFSQMRTLKTVGTVLLLVLLSVGGKISGTLAACHYLKIAPREGVVLALLFNLKGFVDLFIIVIAQNLLNWGIEVYNLLLVTVVINTIIVGTIAALIVNRERRCFGYRHEALELQNPETELRMLACLHGSRHVRTMVGLIGALNGFPKAPIVPYLMHLVEFPDKPKSADLTYHQQENEDFSDAEDYGDNDALEINDAVDGFISEKGVVIRQLKVVSAFASMYEDVCNMAEDIRASIVLLPFHKHQRIDGKMESGKEGIRITNQKILRHARCSVAILIDRGLSGTPQISSNDTDLHVATLFFGGPDDREALAYSRRIGLQSHVNLTVIRFLHASAKDPDEGLIDAGIRKEEDVNEAILMGLPNQEIERAEDSAFLSDFHNRYVASGQIGCVEKYVNNGADTVRALKDMGDMYSLFIVGKGGRGNSPITTGMSDWEECPELGTVGDVLASSEFDIRGSVLVIQQHKSSQADLLDDE